MEPQFTFLYPPLLKNPRGILKKEPSSHLRLKVQRTCQIASGILAIVVFFPYTMISIPGALIGAWIGSRYENIPDIQVPKFIQMVKKVVNSRTKAGAIVGAFFPLLMGLRLLMSQKMTRFTDTTKVVEVRNGYGWNIPTKQPHGAIHELELVDESEIDLPLVRGSRKEVKTREGNSISLFCRESQQGDLEEFNRRKRLNFTQSVRHQVGKCKLSEDTSVDPKEENLAFLELLSRQELQKNQIEITDESLFRKMRELNQRELVLTRRELKEFCKPPKENEDFKFKHLSKREMIRRAEKMCEVSIIKTTDKNYKILDKLVEKEYIRKYVEGLCLKSSLDFIKQYIDDFFILNEHTQDVALNLQKDEYCLVKPEKSSMCFVIFCDKRKIGFTFEQSLDSTAVLLAFHVAKMYGLKERYADFENFLQALGAKRLVTKREIQRQLDIN